MSKLTALFLAALVLVSLFTFTENTAYAARHRHKKHTHKTRHVSHKAKPAARKAKPITAPPEKALYKKASAKLAKLSKDRKRRKHRQYAEQAKKKLKMPPKSAVPVPPSDSMIVVKEDDRPAPSPVPAPTPAPAPHASNGLAMVKSIRHWSNEGNTRVVVDLDGEATYKVGTVTTPDRLTFDVSRAGITSPLSDGQIEINDGILKSVRASQLGRNTVRVVLELESLTSHRALMLKDPPRLVIDVAGRQQQPDGRSITVCRPPATVQSQPPATVPVQQAALKHAQPVEASPVQQAAPVPDKQTPAAKPVVQTVAKAPSVAKQPAPCVGVIVIDPGHGGKDSGAVGKGGLMEKDVVLDVGLRLREILTREFSCKVVMTRDKDVFIDLDARPGIAVQNDADLFISIHANASPNKTATGIETYLLNLTKDRNIMEVAARENMTTIKDMGDLEVILKDLILDSKRDESLRLAHAVQENLVGALKKRNKTMNDKGVKQGPFLVLYGASMPSILTEIGFISNKDEEALLGTSDYRENIAEAVFDGIKAYVDTTKVASAGPAR